ncbi:hypothetical protein [Moraxella lacunata]|uniref:hypothetical protein n=1 Tax=Moraxella lacunata TaxID=477 RepID=UPI003EE38A26
MVNIKGKRVLLCQKLNLSFTIYHLPFTIYYFKKRISCLIYALKNVITLTLPLLAPKPKHG